MKQKLKIVIAQLNYFVGDIAGNTQQILASIERAKNEYQADLICFSELSICGYPPDDLLLRDDFYQQIENALAEICQYADGIAVIVGFPKRQYGELFNACALLNDKQIAAMYFKQRLPNYGVFDEKRYFKTGNQACVFVIKDVPIGLTICEDLWYPEPILQAKAAGAKLIISPNASPYRMEKARSRLQVLQQRTHEAHLPIIYAHYVGGQDEFVFDGGSLVLNAEGEVCFTGDYFKTGLYLTEFEYEKGEVIPQHYPAERPPSTISKVYSALVLAVKDYVEKNHFPGVLIGLSGGIDSALALAIAVDAVGADKVHAVMLPSRYTSEISVEDASLLAKRFGVTYDVISIDETYQQFLNTLYPQFKETTADKTEENLQARIRGALLMALSNKFGKLLLATGNKSEFAVGYATMYGDMCGGFGVLKDVKKTLVYDLAKYRNKNTEVIPQRIIDRAPSAELAPNQKDEDSLPPYNILDPIITAYVEEDKSVEDIVLEGYERSVVVDVVKRIQQNEYKRRQAPPGPRISARSFGRNRRYPTTNGFIIEE